MSEIDFGRHVIECLSGKAVAPRKGDPKTMDRDDWDVLVYDCEANAEGDPRAMVRYAYEAGWKARGV